MASIQNPGDHISEIGPPEERRSRTASRASSTSRRSGGRWSSRSWSRSDVATTRRPSTRRTSRTRRKSGSLPSLGMPTIGPEVARSIVGIVLLVLGAVTLIALALPGQGALTDWWRDSIAPWFETGRWLLPFILLGAGLVRGVGPGQAARTRAGARRWPGSPSPTSASSGRSRCSTSPCSARSAAAAGSGGSSQGVLEPLVTGPGAFVVLVALGCVGLMLAFNLQLRELLRPVTGTARWVGSTAAASMRRDPGAAAGDPARRAATGRRRRRGRLRAARARSTARSDVARADRHLADGCRPATARRAGSRPPCRARCRRRQPSPLPGTGRASPTSATLVADPPRPVRALDDITDAERLAADEGADRVPSCRRSPCSRTSPPRASPAEVPPPTPGTRRSSSKKLASFGITAQIVARNAGPVVTQYEVQPAVDVRVSPDRGARRRPGDGPGGPVAPDRGADPGQERGRDRDPEQGLQRRRPPADPRGGRVHARPSRS